MADEVAQRQTINFPVGLHLNEAEDLFEFIAEKLPANISYRPHPFLAYRHDLESGKLYKDEGTLELGGSITRVREPFSADHFNCFRELSEEEFNKVNGMRFSPIPGYSINDYSPEVVKLWDDVKECAKAFFGESCE
jgi:hypothetical protein